MGLVLRPHDLFPRLRDPAAKPILSRDRKGADQAADVLASPMARILLKRALEDPEADPPQCAIVMCPDGVIPWD